MPLDAVALGAVCLELNNELSGAKVEKVHQPERDEIILAVKSASGLKKLVISAGSANARIHLTDKVKENPSQPPMFCMLLRKHLQTARVTSVKRIGYERIADIEFSARNEMGDLTTRHLICEIMGRNSNIILTDENGRIIDSVKHIDLTVSSVRNVLPGLKYFMPPSPDKINPEVATEEDYYKMLQEIPEGRETDRAISEKVLGISPLLSGECIFRACNSRNKLAGELTDGDKRKIAAELALLFDAAQKNLFSPCIIINEVEKKVIDFSPFEILQYEGATQCKKIQGMNEALCEFYSMRDLRARMNERSSNITRVVNNNLRRAEKKLGILQSELKEAENREYLRICGDIITANLYKIKKGDRELIAVNYYDEKQSEIKIRLDSTKSPSKNAENYYTKYKKAKNTEIYANEQIKKTIEEINYLESVLFSVQNAQSPSELSEIRTELEEAGYIKSESRKKKKEKQPPAGKPMEFSYKGYTIYVGKNNIQNDYLTLRMGRARDLWLHTKNIAGSHTLVKYNGEEFPDDVILTAAKLAACFSKGKNAPYVEVDYCPVSHVKKPSGAKAGMVIYEGYRTALVPPEAELINELRK